MTLELDESYGLGRDELYSPAFHFPIGPVRENPGLVVVACLLAIPLIPLLATYELARDIHQKIRQSWLRLRPYFARVEL